MTRLPVTLACGEYDRTAALRNSAVTPEGIDLNYLAIPPEEVFFRMLKFHEFDVVEMSLSSYLIPLERTGDFIAIPVLPSRTFRHNAIYVNAHAGIESPADLMDRCVGVPEYQMTTAVFIRGYLPIAMVFPYPARSIEPGVFTNRGYRRNSHCLRNGGEHRTYSRRSRTGPDIDIRRIGRPRQRPDATVLP
ncbi:hypothetical protein ACIHDR_47465 [Nocardia sp. NPDC052278]|uniref:hypothetical protein n=1 Tax=unclassified Nocardia TaxID=2637762 RepID=UPI003676A35C